MFSHIMIGANDIEESKAFYDATLAALGHGEGKIDDNGRCFYFAGDNVLALTKPINGEPASHGNGVTIGFAAASPEEIHAWHDAGVANGGTTCEEPPGIRETPKGALYLAYLLDPAGNKLCGLHRV